MTVTGEIPEAVRDGLSAASALVTTDRDAAPKTQDVVALAQADYANLLEVLYANGYYGAVIRVRLDGLEAAELDPLRAPPRISTIEIAIDPGRPFRFGTARAAPLAPDTELPPEFAPNEIARAATVRAAAQAAVGAWKAQGHAKADILDGTVLARHPTEKLDVYLKVTPGPKLTFGKIDVTGASSVRAKRVRDIAGLPIGETYSPEAVEKAAQRLRETGTFDSVDLVERAGVGPGQTQDIQIAVVDRAPRRIGAGLEVGTLDGITLSGFWLHRNLLGGAEQFRVSGEVTQLGRGNLVPDYSLSFDFLRPAIYGPDTGLYAGVSLSYEDEPDFEQRKVALKLGVTREVSETVKARLGIGFERSDVTDRTGSGGSRDLKVFSLTGGVTVDRRDDDIDPTSGYYLDGEARPFLETVSSKTGLRLYVDGRIYRAFGGDRPIVAALRGQVGHVSGPNRFQMPPDYLFYSGGGGTVRGQPFEALGFTRNTIRTGGQSFVGLSGELRFKVTDRLGLVAFADTGFVGAEGFEDGDWHSGAGFGARYATPLGPLRVDLAGPVSGSTGNGVQLYIGIGQAF